jgi:murein DD-endopeptidase MepM/ murein hydrolase activator NlpD
MHWLITSHTHPSGSRLYGERRHAIVVTGGLTVILFILYVAGDLFGSPLSFPVSKRSQAFAAAPLSANSQTMRLLQGARNLDPNPARGGGEVLIADNSALMAESGPSGTQADIEDEPGSDEISLYVVREGDTLSQIAQMFKVSVNTIRWANDIGAGRAIQPGETLLILPISGVRHTVKAGETLQSIVKKYEGDMGEVLSYNGFLEGVKLSVGSVVVIPNGVLAAPKVQGGQTTRGVSGPSIAGYFIRPVTGIRTQGLHGFNGVDLAGAVGAPVVAAASGEVIVSRTSGWNGGYGIYVVIRHSNGTQTLYAHLNSSIVGVGSSVVQGQVIGYVGMTGRTTGPHLHFEVRGAKNPF